MALVLLALIIMQPISPARADPSDISAASRSVVRIVLVAREEGRVFYVGHGSGFAIAPNLIVTNAHLVEPMLDDPSIIIGIVPSQGERSYGGTVVKVSRENDLALIRMDEGRVPPLTLLQQPLGDGSDVVAIGYPSAVDRAEGLRLTDLISPLAPVKTPGVISGGRTAREFETILHTAALAAGNSGGPLVDRCGRVIGVNSFGSLSDGTDAEFGFAVSNRELTKFLRGADVEYRTTDSPCRSAAELSAEDRERERREQMREAARQRAENERALKRQIAARDNAERSIMEQRENFMAAAMILLALATLAGGYALLQHDRERVQPTRIAGGVAAGLAVLSILLLVLRPSYRDVEDRAAALLDQERKQNGGDAASKPAGDGSGTYACKLVPERSRVTVSEMDEITIGWTANGCVNGRTQYGEEAGRWSRIFVPDQEDAVSINSFDPETRTFTMERFLLDLDAITKAREIRGRYTYDQCVGPDSRQRTELEDMQKALRLALPGQPNERLVFECSLSKATTPAE